MTSPSTPFLRIDDAVARRNVQKLASYAAVHNIGVRPHTKTHKSLYFAHTQLEAGAIGLTVAKPGEAEVMARTGADLLLAYPVIDEGGRRRMAELARETSLRVALDSFEAAKGLGGAAIRAGSTIGILVDLDVGMHRTGVQTPEAALQLARAIQSVPGLRIDGLFCYPGHVFSPPGQQAEQLKACNAPLELALELFKKGGFDTGIVSAGSTPTAYQTHLMPAVTEIRSGTYIFNDMNCVLGRFCELDDCAARFECTVVSNAVPGQVVIDAGNKTLTHDRNAISEASGFGHIVEYPGAVITKLSEEHGQVDISACDKAPKIGERVSVIPNHVCPSVNLHDSFWLQGLGGELQQMPVEGRGKVF